MQREFITFEVSGQYFGIDIMAIREIRAWTPVARLPSVPAYVAGVVNLRGAILPVVDLAARLGWEATEISPRHAIVVIQVSEQTRGLIVDSVSDIVQVPNDQIQLPPPMAPDSVLPFIEGLIAMDDRMVMVLDLSALSGDNIKMAA